MAVEKGRQGHTFPPTIFLSRVDKTLFILSERERSGKMSVKNAQQLQAYNFGVVFDTPGRPLG